MGIKIGIFDVQFFYEDLRGLNAYHFHLGRVLRMLKVPRKVFFFLARVATMGKILMVDNLIKRNIFIEYGYSICKLQWQSSWFLVMTVSIACSIKHVLSLFLIFSSVLWDSLGDDKKGC